MCFVDLLWILLTIPVILGVGFGAESMGLLHASRRNFLNALAYYIALPALLFTSTAGRSVADIVTSELVLGVGTVFVLTIGLAFLLHRTPADPRIRSVGLIQSYHTNFGYLGVPLVAVIFGDLATARAAVILGIGALIQVTMSVTILSTMNGKGTRIGEVRRIIRNPILLSLAAGLTVSALSISLPSAPFAILEHIGGVALPLALLCVGASLTLSTGLLVPWTTGVVIVINVLFMPVAAFLTFIWLGADTSTIQAAVLMFAMPTAVSTYVFAGELGGDTDLASVNVFATTVVSTGTLFLVVHLLHLLG